MNGTHVPPSMTNTTPHVLSDDPADTWEGVPGGPEWRRCARCECWVTEEQFGFGPCDGPFVPPTADLERRIEAAIDRRAAELHATSLRIEDAVGTLRTIADGTQRLEAAKFAKLLETLTDHRDGLVTVGVITTVGTVCAIVTMAILVGMAFR